MKKLNELQSYLTRLRGLMLTLVILLTIGSGNAWGQVSLPYEWTVSAGKGSLPSGVTHSGLGSDYAAANAPYYLKYDGAGDYIQIYTNKAAGDITFRVKKIGGASNSTFVVEGCATASGTYSEINSFTISGAKNAVVECQTSASISSSYRYFRIRMSAKGANVGLGYVLITTPCTKVDVTGGSAVILPKGSTTYTTSDWGNNGAPTGAYPTSATVKNVYGYCVTFTNAYENNQADGLQVKASGGVISMDIVSNYGVDVEVVCSGTNGFSIALTGATTKTGQTGTATISTTTTEPTLTITKNTSSVGYIKTVKITPKTASCSSDPVMTSAAASLKGSFSLTSVGVTATDWNPNTSCAWVDYGFVWGTSSNPSLVEATGDAASGCTKVQKGTSGSATTWDDNLTGSFTLGNTYHYRAYGKNGKTGAEYKYSADQTFTPRSVTFNLNGHGSSAPATQYVNNGGKAADPSYSESVSGWTFGGWYDNADWTQGTQWNFGSSTVSGANVTLYAKWTEKPKYTVTLDAGNGTISDVSWTNTSGSVYTKTQANGDESITLPTPSCNCAGWVFQGWSTTSKSNAASFTPDKTDGASFVPAANVTYYAVYRQSMQTGTTYTKITTAEALTSGDYAIVAYTGAGYYAMGDGISSSHMTETSAAADSWTNSTANYIWTIIKVGDKVAFYNANAGKFLTIVDGAWVLATDGQKFSYSFNSTTKAWTFTSPSGKQIAYNVYYYVQDEQTKDVYLYKRGYAASGNYYTSPSCSGLSITGASNPAGAATIYLTNTAAHEGDKIWATYTLNRGYSFNRWSKSGTGASLSSTSAEFTQLTVGSTDVTVTANFDALTSYTLNYHDGDGNHTMTVYEGENILSILPEPSESCDDGSTDFVGWSTTEIRTKTDDEPTFVSSSAVINSTTAAATYYAVYADVTTEPGSLSILGSAGSAFWGASYNSNDKNIDDSNGNTITLKTSNIIFQKPSSNPTVQIKNASGAGFWNDTEMPGYITQIKVKAYTAGLKLYVGTSKKPTSTNEKTISSTSEQTYDFDADDKLTYFSVFSNSATPQITSIIITYAGEYGDFITTCCDDPGLAFTYTGVATAEELVRENKTRLDAADEVVLTYTTSSSGTITDPTSASVYKLSYGSRATEGGSAASAHVDAISIDKSTKKITLSIKTTSSGGNTGCGTYRVALSQAAYNSGGDNYCEKTAYGFVDVKIKYEFIDAVNGNTTVIKYNTGSGVLFPTAGELSGGSNCHSETRLLKGWISETKLTNLYGSSTRVLTLDDVKDAANTIVAPGADGKGIYAQGTKWYAVWAYER